MRRSPVCNRSWTVVCCLVLCACDGDSAAQKSKAKRARDAALLSLPYPASSGTLPKSVTIRYDVPTDRTTMTIQLVGLVADGLAANADARLMLTSSHKGATRQKNNPEGAVDGAVTVLTSKPGTLAFAGSPGALIADGESMELGQTDTDVPYTSRPVPQGHEETVRFRLRTEDLVAGVNAKSVSMTLGTIRLTLGEQHLADLREFASRLNPPR